MRILLIVFCMLFVPVVARADIVSTTYVNTAITTKVDTQSTANQTMAGKYTVSGTFVVPTPPLPTAE